MSKNGIGGAWAAREALRTIVNRGFSYKSVRVWFTGDVHVLIRDSRLGRSGHLEMLFPARTAPVTELVDYDTCEALRADLIPRSE